MMTSLLTLTLLASPVVFEVPGLTCPTCVKPVQKALALAKGVQRVRVDLEHRRVTVEFDAGQTDEATLRALLTDTGFPASAAGAPPAAQGKADWVRVGVPPPAPASLAVRGKATVIAVCSPGCAPCEGFKKSLGFMAQRVPRVAIREVQVTDSGPSAYLPKDASVPYAYVYDLTGAQVFAGAAGDAVFQAVEGALGVTQ
jgi:copper chaperone CopZ